jgi:hypothetical protein
VLRGLSSQLSDVGSEYDARRPLTPTGTNLLGLVNHLATWEAVFVGDVFDRQFASPPLQPDAATAGSSDDLWVTADVALAETIERFRRVAEHAEARSTHCPAMRPGMWRGGRDLTSRSSTSSSTSSRRRVSTSAMPTSCASNSTE